MFTTCPIFFFLSVKPDMNIYILTVSRGLVRNSNPWVPLHKMRSILGQILLVLVYIGSQNFAGARYRNSKFCGCQVPVAPVLSRPLIYQGAYCSREHTFSNPIAKKQNLYVLLFLMLKVVSSNPIFS